jgi:hypothetical protein
MPRQPDAASPLARRWAFASGGSLATLASAIVALLIIGPDLPVPDIEWPGDKPLPSKSPYPETHRPDPRPQTGVPGDGQPPNPGPQLLPPSLPATPGSPAPPPKRPGVLDVGPRSIHFRRHDRVAGLYLTAHGGSVTWAAVPSSPQLTLSRTRGRIRDAGHVTIRITLERGLLTLPGVATIRLIDGAGHDMQVTFAWDTSVL